MTSYGAQARLSAFRLRVPLRSIDVDPVFVDTVSSRLVQRDAQLAGEKKKKQTQGLRRSKRWMMISFARDISKLFFQRENSSLGENVSRSGDEKRCIGKIFAYQQMWNVGKCAPSGVASARESMQSPSDRWQHCSPVPAHMCKDGRPRGRLVVAFAHVRISLSRQRCARLTRPSCGIGPGGRAPLEEDSWNESQRRSRKNGEQAPTRDIPDFSWTRARHACNHLAWVPSRSSFVLDSLVLV